MSTTEMTPVVYDFLVAEKAKYPDYAVTEWITTTEAKPVTDGESYLTGDDLEVAQFLNNHARDFEKAWYGTDNVFNATTGKTFADERKEVV